MPKVVKTMSMEEAFPSKRAWLSRMNFPDPDLFNGISKEVAMRWAAYFYGTSRDTKKAPTLKTRTFALYDPFAKRSVFPAGIRYCVNVYTGCAHQCKYCYTQNYILKAKEPREKKDLLRKAERDIKKMLELDLPPAPLHISNSTDPFQELLESSTQTTLSMMKLVAKYRQCFTRITFLTKNPILASEEPYVSLLKSLEPCQVEVSLTFCDDVGRAFYDPYAPSVQSRLQGIQQLRAAGILVSLRIDPLFPREPLPMPYWDHQKLNAYGVERTHSLEEIKDLVQFAANEGCQKVIISPLKIPIGRRTRSDLKEYFRPLYTAPFEGKPKIRGFAMRLPEEYTQEELFPPVIEMCESEGIPVAHCKHNLITTK